MNKELDMWWCGVGQQWADDDDLLITGPKIFSGDLQVSFKKSSFCSAAALLDEGRTFCLSPAAPGAKSRVSHCHSGAAGRALCVTP